MRDLHVYVDSEQSRSIITQFSAPTDDPIDRRGVCIDANGTWHVADRFTQSAHICEWRGMIFYYLTNFSQKNA